eukprot:TRINITY_DN3621_c0_g1_i3.p1 TRINITY_DN3621_c0_g1~~TRINITY_DN3621_c0_g1_i3.p1  ORF type:complete len:302 (+),score=52.27 TRINITY_DN3621_c0_g1_i3:95-1000(+)
MLACARRCLLSTRCSYGSSIIFRAVASHSKTRPISTPLAETIIPDPPKIEPPTSFRIPVTTLAGEPSDEFDLPVHIFGVPVRKDILHRVVIWKLACQRRGTGSAKSRGEKQGSSKKLYRQKKTGRARVGTRRSPIRRGGGTAHPPKPRDFSYTLPKKVRLLGMKCALSSKFAQGKLVLVENFELPTIKTKGLVQIMKTRGWKDVLFIDGEEITPYFYLASRNLSTVDTIPQHKANVYDILRRELLVLNRASLDHLIARVEGRLPPIKKSEARSRKKKRLTTLAKKISENKPPVDDLTSVKE